ncbi:hypothetical protein BDF20DRAFT_897841 [Mycotypha africana]|uniref:uncharacterized protein n=1 Tax=Mycotypha africana TaxID=64632 RepID=UPI002301E7E9|nr:uncharacterized protein BDF20DRAFT_897841 [Mycotypha africana]KAI8967917.1 hypothetical protein BDF20DRAFT_897841 [Mycotypha africana]
MNAEELEIGTVLYNAGDTKHSDYWDDSELIEHWDRTIDTYRKYYSKPRAEEEQKLPNFDRTKDKAQEGCVKKRKQMQKKKKSNLAKLDPSAAQQQFVRQKQQYLPQTVEQDIEKDISNLMMSWYYCGYYTGVYQEKRQKKAISALYPQERTRSPEV